MWHSEDLAPPLICYSTLENRPCTLPWQHNRADLGDREVNDPDGEYESRREYESLLSMAAWGDLARAVAGELAPIVQAKESQQADQLSRHPDPNPGL